MSSEDQSCIWSEQRRKWAAAATREAAQRQAWRHPLMTEIEDAMNRMAGEGWLSAACGSMPMVDERVLVWNPYDRPFIGYREADDRRWWALVDGDLWPMARPLMWRRLVEPPRPLPAGAPAGVQVHRLPDGHRTPLPGDLVQPPALEPQEARQTHDRPWEG